MYFYYSLFLTTACTVNAFVLHLCRYMHMVQIKQPHTHIALASFLHSPYLITGEKCWEYGSKLYRTVFKKISLWSSRKFLAYEAYAHNWCWIMLCTSFPMMLCIWGAVDFINEQPEIEHWYSHVQYELQCGAHGWRGLNTALVLTYWYLLSKYCVIGMAFCNFFCVNAMKSSGPPWPWTLCCSSHWTQLYVYSTAWHYIPA